MAVAGELARGEVVVLVRVQSLEWALAPQAVGPRSTLAHDVGAVAQIVSLGSRARGRLERIAIAYASVDGHHDGQAPADDAHVDLDHCSDTRDDELLCQEVLVSFLETLIMDDSTSHTRKVGDTLVVHGCRKYRTNKTGRKRTEYG